MRVRRLATEAGESLLGRVLTPEQAHAFRDAFGLAGGPLMSSAEMHEAILIRGASFDLANGWRLARRRLMGAVRVEIEGPADGDLAALKRMGCATEIVSWRTRVTKRAEAIIANTYLAGTNTRRVRRALAGLFGGKVGKDAVSRAWRKVKTDWESWQARDLSGEDIVRLILDGTGVKARLDGRVLSIPLLVVLGVRRDGQKVLLAVKTWAGRPRRPGAMSWRTFSAVA